MIQKQDSVLFTTFEEFEDFSFFNYALQNRYGSLVTEHYEMWEDRGRFRAFAFKLFKITTGHLNGGNDDSMDGLTNTFFDQFTFAEVASLLDKLKSF